MDLDSPAVSGAERKDREKVDAEIAGGAHGDYDPTEPRKMDREGLGKVRCLGSSGRSRPKTPAAPARVMIPPRPLC